MLAEKSSWATMTVLASLFKVNASGSLADIGPNRNQQNAADLAATQLRIGSLRLT
jgi:hypothetical protein